MSRLSSLILRWVVLTVLVGTAALLLSRGCGPLLARRMDPDEAVMRLRLRGLEGLLASAAEDSLVPFDQALVVIDERLVQNLLLAAVPYSGTVAGGIRIALKSAEVSFDDGAALFRLDGTAGLGRAAGSGDSLARVNVFGELDVVDLDPQINVLRMRLRVIAVDAQDVSVPLLAPVVERIVENLGWLRIESFEGLNYHLEVPVRLGNELRLPEIGPEGGVRIAAATIPLRVTVQSVEAFHDKLWVSLSATVVHDADSTESSPDSAMPRGSKRLTTEVRRDTRTVGAKVDALRAEVAALHDSLVVLVASDEPIAMAVADTAEIAIALREDFIMELLSETARRYLDRVELDIDTEDLQACADGELEVKTPLGKMTAGRWEVQLDFHRLRGRLRAKRPQVIVTAKNRVHVVVPTVIESGTGEATLTFGWDPKGLANIVCRPFETTQRIEGHILSREYLLRGDFLLTAGSESIVADPMFPVEKFPIAVDFSEETWVSVMEALHSQDRWNRCGMMMSPEKVALKLAVLGEEGFKVKLPQEIFRPVVIPASLVKSVRVGRSQVELSIRPNALRVSPGTFWYSASFDTEVKGVLPEPSG